MRPLRFSINVTLDGCCDHRVVPPPYEALHRHAAENFDRSDALLFGRVTYQMMEEAFRPGIGTAADPGDPYVRAIDQAKKFVVSRTLENVSWNAELITGDLREAVLRLKQEDGKGISVGGLQLARALSEMDLIDEYEFVVHPRVVGHGPYLFAGLSKHADLKLLDRLELGSGVFAMRYAPRSQKD